jgi:hypothetical protein
MGVVSKNEFQYIGGGGEGGQTINYLCLYLHLTSYLQVTGATKVTQGRQAHRVKRACQGAPVPRATKAFQAAAPASARKETKETQGNPARKETKASQALRARKVRADENYTNKKKNSAH